MARIRSIKPEFWTPEQIMECSTNARLLFIGLWNFCDDEGRHPESVRRLKAEVFPGDDLTLEGVQSLVDELVAHGLIDVYETAQGEGFWQVTGWHHQRIDKPQDSRFPPLSECIPRTFQERSKNVPRPFPPDRSGVDRSGVEGNGDSPFVERSTNEPAVLTFPCSGKIKNWNLTQSQIDEWSALFPTVDILAESRKALAWVKAKTPKTAKGMPQYLVGWFGRTNDKQRGNAQPLTRTERNRKVIAEWEAKQCQTEPQQ
jgi:hypothetical protein